MKPVDTPLQYVLDRFSQSSILAQLNSSLIFTIGERQGPEFTSYRLDTRSLQPEYILRCWISQHGQLEQCSPEQYLARRNIQGAAHTEFAVLEQQDIAEIVWEMARYGMGRGGGGRGGTHVLQKADVGWVQSPEMGDVWIS